jgi:hypothetical protein
LPDIEIGFADFAPPRAAFAETLLAALPREAAGARFDFAEDFLTEDFGFDETLAMACDCCSGLRAGKEMWAGYTTV